jgi:hypothetical protein
MKNWFTSLNGALTLSFLALLIELWRGFLDFAFIYPVQTKGMEVIAATVYAVLFGVWMYGLSKGQQSSRAGIVAAMMIGVIFLLVIDLGTIFFYCPHGCTRVESNLSAWTGLVVGTLAIIALALQVRKPT